MDGVTSAGHFDYKYDEVWKPQKKCQLWLKALLEGLLKILLSEIKTINTFRSNFAIPSRPQSQKNVLTFFSFFSAHYKNRLVTLKP